MSLFLDRSREKKMSCRVAEEKIKIFMGQRNLVKFLSVKFDEIRFTKRIN